jgi:hypothetical protein
MKMKHTDCLYEITEFYISEGHHPEEAEDLAWKSVQGGGILIPDPETIRNEESDFQPTNQTVHFDYVPMPF